MTRMPIEHRRNTRSACFAAALGLSMALADGPLATADVIYVDDSVPPTGANDGSSWADAFRKIRPALAAAQPGDVVRVGQGVYTPANPGGPREASIEIPDGVRVIGGYAGVGAPDPDDFDPSTYITTFSGDLNGDDGPDFANDGENSWHVVTFRETNPGTVLRGVTVTGGNAHGTPLEDDADGAGGGIACIAATVTLRDCIIEGNRALEFGGGVAAVSLFFESRAIHMRNCTVRGNETTSPTGKAGGVYASPHSTFADCLFEDNFCPLGSIGGALTASDATFERCEFIDNVSGDEGGAVRGSDLEVIDCTFTGNISGWTGGAMSLSGDNIVRNCVFDDNRASVNGGAIRLTSDATIGTSIIQCDFMGNESDNGGAVSNRHNPVRLINCRFFDNMANGTGSFFAGGGAVECDEAELSAVNCLFSGNTSVAVGAAVRVVGRASLINCTIVGNQNNTTPGAAPGGAVHVGVISEGGILNLHNCILWDNAGDSATVEAQQVSGIDEAVFHIRNCIVQGWSGDLGGSQNNGDDPLLIDPDGADDTIGTDDDDPRLSVGSPAINSGRNDLLPRDDFDLDGDGTVTERISLDLDGEPRIRQGIVDRGAFEFQP